MTQYLRESWDLHLAALVAFLCIGLILFWATAIPLWAVPAVAVGGAALFVFLGLWMLALFGVTIPW